MWRRRTPNGCCRSRVCRWRSGARTPAALIPSRSTAPGTVNRCRTTYQIRVISNTLARPATRSASLPPRLRPEQPGEWHGADDRRIDLERWRLWCGLVAVLDADFVLADRGRVHLHLSEGCAGFRHVLARSSDRTAIDGDAGRQRWFTLLMLVILDQTVTAQAGVGSTLTNESVLFRGAQLLLLGVGT